MAEINQPDSKKIDVDSLSEVERKRLLEDLHRKDLMRQEVKSLVENPASQSNIYSDAPAKKLEEAQATNGAASSKEKSHAEGEYEKKIFGKEGPQILQALLDEAQAYNKNSKSSADAYKLNDSVIPLE